MVRPPVLIPRPETEFWTLKLASYLTQVHGHPTRKLSLLDLGTGSGCIPLLLCSVMPPGCLRAHGIDISSEAVKLSLENAVQCGIPSTNDPSKNSFTVSSHDIFSQLSDIPASPPFDIVTSNPPYISWEEFLELPKSVAAYEDWGALFGGPSGLEFYYAIAEKLANPAFLSEDGVVAVEIGWAQAEDVKAIFRDIGTLSDLTVWKDAWGKDRTVVARKKRPPSSSPPHLARPGN
jgi:HemK-like putative methylase